jgi:hypothetical protein
VLTPRASDGRDRCRGSSSPSSSGWLSTKRRAKASPVMVSVSNNGRVFECRGPPWRRFVGMLPTWSLSSR